MQMTQILIISEWVRNRDHIHMTEEVRTPFSPIIAKRLHLFYHCFSQHIVHYFVEKNHKTGIAFLILSDWKGYNVFGDKRERSELSLRRVVTDMIPIHNNTCKNNNTTNVPIRRRKECCYQNIAGPTMRSKEAHRSEEGEGVSDVERSERWKHAP